MTTLHILLPLAAAWALAVVLPGPNFLVIVWTAAARGRRPALAAALGVLTGALFWIAAGLFGLKVLFAALPVAGTAIRLLGAAYIVWFGLQMLLRPDRAGGASTGAGMAAYRSGLATTLSNPKSAAVAASLLAAGLPADASPGLGGEAFVMLIAISSCWYLGVALVGSLPPLVARLMAARRRLSQVAGVVFILFGLRLAVEP
ncbi:MAG TPA: LysE family transporter [Bauldia sp.]|nr:LysE family transporter [Bauldia sp.]